MSTHDVSQQDKIFIAFSCFTRFTRRGGDAFCRLDPVAAIMEGRRSCSAHLAGVGHFASLIMPCI